MPLSSLKKKYIAWLTAVSMASAIAVPTAGLAAEPAGDSEGTPVVISETEGSPVPISDTDGVPVVISAPASDKITLADIVTVAQHISGNGTLTEEQMERYDLEGDGSVTMTDLQLLVKEYISELNGTTDEPPQPDPENATVAVVGTITTSDEAENTWYIRQDDVTALDETGAIISDDTIIVDCASGDLLNTTALVPGTRVAAYISVVSMPSLPPRAACYAVIVNLPETGNGNASYIYASEVRDGEDGSVVVLNQNSDLYVTVPADTPIGILGKTDTDASVSDIKAGTRFIAWFDIVGLSYPAKTTALRVMIDSPDASEPEQPLPEYATMSVDGTIESVDSAENIVTVKDADSEMEAVITDDTIIVDCAAGTPADVADIKEGDRAMAYLSTETLPDWPSRADCRALLLNPSDSGEDFTAYVYVQSTETPEDAKDTKVLVNQNGDLYITINDATELSVLGDNDASVTSEDIIDGSRVIVWYKPTLNSSRPEGIAVRAIVVPDTYVPGVPAVEGRPTETIYGTIASVDEASHTVSITPNGGDAQDDIKAVLSDETVIVDSATGDILQIGTLKEGETVAAYIETMVTPSLPPTSGCVALITGLSSDGMGNASYVCASEVRDGADGSVVVLNQNGDLYVTIPGDMKVEVIGDGSASAAPADIKVGSRLIVWYDIVLTSYPGQTAALRAMLIPE